VARCLPFRSPEALSRPLPYLGAAISGSARSAATIFSRTRVKMDAAPRGFPRPCAPPTPCARLSHRRKPRAARARAQNFPGASGGLGPANRRRAPPPGGFRRDGRRELGIPRPGAHPRSHKRKLGETEACRNWVGVLQDELTTKNHH
jgi:hypothetical protein